MGQNGLFVSVNGTASGSSSHPNGGEFQNFGDDRPVVSLRVFASQPIHALLDLSRVSSIVVLIYPDIASQGKHSLVRKSLKFW